MFVIYIIVIKWRPVEQLPDCQADEYWFQINSFGYTLPNYMTMTNIVDSRSETQDIHPLFI